MCVVPLTETKSLTLMYCLIGVSFLIQMFDVYLDMRQKKTYKHTELPTEFEYGYKLAD